MNRIKRLRTEHKMSQIELAEALHIHQTAVSQWETGKTNPDMTQALQLADYFNVTTDYILGRIPHPPALESKIIPVYGVIPAGIPMEAIEDIIDYEEIPAEMTAGGKEYFALKIRGNSMYPDYVEDDVVIFLKAQDFDSGDECAVIVNGTDATFKKVIKQEGGIVLQPLNVAEYEPVYYCDREIEELPVSVIGIVRELRRKK